MNSLRVRLLAWLLPSALCAAILGSVATYWGAAFELSNMLDDQLRYVAEHTHLQGDQVTIDRSNVFHERLTDESVDEVLVQIWEGSKLRYTSNAARAMDAPVQVGLSDVMAGGQIWHSFVLQRGDYRIRVAQAKDERWEALAKVAVHLIWPIVVLVPLLGLSLWVGIGRGLRPLQQIANELSTRDSASMAPIHSEPLPSEVRSMVQALNQLLERLDRSFEQQRNFLADAAHELRTPIMALSVQANLAATAPSTADRELAVSRVCLGTGRLARLADQLLTLARLEPGAALPKLERVDLLDLGRTAVVDASEWAETRGVDLGLASHDPLYIQGDLFLLQILTRNLVDNAVRYTPAGGSVDVWAWLDGDVPVLSVVDTGPGIPPADHARVFDRFYRGSQRSETGSGLGLSIVRRVAETHGATLRILPGCHGRGTRIDVCFGEHQAPPATVRIAASVDGIG